MKSVEKLQNRHSRRLSNAAVLPCARGAIRVNNPRAARVPGSDGQGSLASERRRARLGIPLNIEPRYFPADIDLASCMTIAAERQGLPVGDFVNAVMRAIWAEDRNPADPAVLASIARGCGLDGDGLVEAAAGEAVRAEYRGNTQRALAAGVFGSPFYRFEGELFWGQDRLDMLEAVIIRSRSGDLGRSPDQPPPGPFAGMQ
jgi:2-hydroxychromene-2-carboxylate isomerase